MKDFCRNCGKLIVKVAGTKQTWYHLEKLEQEGRLRGAQRCPASTPRIYRTSKAQPAQGGIAIFNEEKA